MDATALATFLTNVGSVFTSMTGWAGSIGDMISSTAVLFVPCVLGISFTVVGFFMRMKS